MNITTENRQKLDKETSDKVSFISFIIPMFADAYKMNIREAWLYLKQYGGWDFLNKHWWALHTDNVLYALNDIYEVCYKNGGRRYLIGGKADIILTHRTISPDEKTMLTLLG